MKNRIINYLFRHLLNAVVPEDVIKTEKGKLLIGGIEVQDTELRSLIAEVKALEGFRIWKIMNETIRSEAMDLGFNKSLTYDDLKTSKMMLYTLDVFNSIIKVIRSRESKVV